MKRALFVVLVATLTLEWAQSQNVGSGFVGQWQGYIDPEGLELGVIVQFDHDDKLTGTIDIPAQGLMTAPLELRNITENTITFAMPGIPGEPTFEGTLAGNTLEGTFTQGGQNLPFQLERVAEGQTPSVGSRPQDPVPPYPYLEKEVTYQQGDVTLAGTLTLPEGEGPFPAVLMLTGSGSQNRNEELFNHRPFLVLADAMTRTGVAVLRVDDRGVGGSTGDLTRATFEDLSADALAGIEFLKAQEEIDDKKIGLFGHSEGGYLAPLVASKSEDVAFVILMAAPSVPGLEVLKLQNELIFEQAGASQEATKAQLAYLDDLALLLEAGAYDAAQELSRKQIEQQLAGVPAEAQPQGEEREAFIETQSQAVSSPIFSAFLNYDPTTALEALDIPVLAFYGGLDIQVPPSQSESVMKNLLANNPDATVQTFEGLNHLMQPAMTGALEEYAEIETTIAPEVLELITSWLEERFVD
jgi:uncharacterized protein